MTLDPSRRRALLTAKLTALVRSSGADAERARPLVFPAGAALQAGDALWVLADEAPARSLGAALVLASRNGACRLHMAVEGDAAAVLSRRAPLFTIPVQVWRVDGTSLSEAHPMPVEPEPPLHPLAELYRALFERAGAEAVVEAGILRAEVRGLEVARVEVDGDDAYLAVGVGKHDREAKRMVHGGEQGWQELMQTIRVVAQRRVEGGIGSPAYQLAAERWLRWVVTGNPELVGARELAPVAPPVRRGDLRDTVPAPAAGHGTDGEPLLVVCSVGVDPDLVPSAADSWLADGRQPRLVLCVPEGDDHPVTYELAELLSVPLEVRVVPAGWRSLR